MTYERLFYLKYRKGIPTYELVRLYPADVARVSEVALLDLPDTTLKDILKEKKAVNRLLKLKKRFAKFL